MRSKTLSVIMVIVQLAALVALFPATVSAAEFSAGSFRCSVLDDGTVSITGTNSRSNSNLIIPATLNGRDVTAIADSAFDGCDWLESVALPDSVRSIGNYAFYGCPSLHTVFLSAGVNSIGQYAFASCDVLQNIHVDDRNMTYSDISGVLTSYDGKTLVCCPGGRYGKVIVPDGITTIAKNAFCWCSGIEIIVLPDSVKSIGQYAFSGCSSLVELILPGGITAIEKETFAYCLSLKEIAIPDGVTSIGEKAFYSCTALTRADVPASVTSIAESAFKYDNSGTDRPLGSLTMYCPSGSAAMVYCQNNGINFVHTGGMQPPRPSTPSGPSNPGKTQRLAGSDRINTAILVSREGWASASVVVLANGFSYPDALAGVPLAAAVEAPILLTAGKTLEPAVAAEISRLGASKVYILGGSAAVSSSVERSLTSSGLTVTRLAGNNRYETAVKIALELELRSDRRFNNFFLVCSTNFADALSVSTIAALDGNPILYVPKDGNVDQITAEFMCGTVCRSATIIGGTSAVSPRTEKSVTVLGFSIARLSGTDRYSTSLAVCEYYRDRFTGKDAVIATGANFPDALSGGVFAARSGVPMVLVNSSSAPSVRTYLAGRGTGRMFVLGGTAVIPDSVLNQISV